MHAKSVRRRDPMHLYEVDPPLLRSAGGGRSTMVAHSSHSRLTLARQHTLTGSAFLAYISPKELSRLRWRVKSTTSRDSSRGTSSARLEGVYIFHKIKVGAERGEKRGAATLSVVIVYRPWASHWRLMGVS